MRIAHPKLHSGQVRLLGRALRLIWESGPQWCVANAVLIVVQAAVPVLTLYLMKRLIDTVTGGLSAPNKHAVFSQILVVIALSAGLALVGVVCEALADIVRDLQTEAVTDYVHSIPLLHDQADDELPPLIQVVADRSGFLPRRGENFGGLFFLILIELELVHEQILFAHALHPAGHAGASAGVHPDAFAVPHAAFTTAAAAATTLGRSDAGRQDRRQK